MTQILLKPGDKVRVKSMDQEWIVSQEAYLIVEEVGDFTEAHGIPQGARCRWANRKGPHQERVYPLHELAPA